MAADVMLLANGDAIATDSVSVATGNTTRTAHRQVVVTVPAADPSVSALPPGQRFSAPLLGPAASTSLVVDGSTTPVVFTWSPPSSRAAVIAELVLMFAPAAAAVADGFGAAAALANGLLLELVIGGETVEAWIVRRHVDAVAFGGALELLPAGQLALRLPLGIELGDADQVRVTVSDNLTAIGTLRAYAVGRQFDPSVA
jgi:hypothetical protein